MKILHKDEKVTFIIESLNAVSREPQYIELTHMHLCFRETDIYCKIHKYSSLKILHVGSSGSEVSLPSIQLVKIYNFQIL